MNGLKGFLTSKVTIYPINSSKGEDHDEWKEVWLTLLVSFNTACDRWNSLCAAHRSSWQNKRFQNHARNRLKGEKQQ